LLNIRNTLKQAVDKPEKGIIIILIGSPKKTNKNRELK
jgi:hypothetical protein